MPLPQSDGVSYLIVWQMPGMTRIAQIPQSLDRDDIFVIISDTSGLSISRNIAIAAASADICMIADDDTVLLPDAFKDIKKTFASDKTLDIALFRIMGKRKTYPSGHTRLHRKMPHGYWVTSSEITFRTSSIKGQIQFREKFGLGSPRFTAAEEAFFISDALRRGLSVAIVPIEICTQPQLSSGERPFTSDGGFPASQGAYIRHIHGIICGIPHIFMLALRARRTHKAPFLFTLKHAFQGFTCKTTEML